MISKKKIAKLFAEEVKDVICIGEWQADSQKKVIYCMDEVDAVKLAHEAYHLNYSEHPRDELDIVLENCRINHYLKEDYPKTKKRFEEEIKKHTCGDKVKDTLTILNFDGEQEGVVNEVKRILKPVLEDRNLPRQKINEIYDKAKELLPKVKKLDFEFPFDITPEPGLIRLDEEVLRLGYLDGVSIKRKRKSKLRNEGKIKSSRLWKVRETSKIFYKDLKVQKVTKVILAIDKSFSVSRRIEDYIFAISYLIGFLAGSKVKVTAFLFDSEIEDLIRDEELDLAKARKLEWTIGCGTKDYQACKKILKFLDDNERALVFYLTDSELKEYNEAKNLANEIKKKAVALQVNIKSKPLYSLFTSFYLSNHTRQTFRKLVMNLGKKLI